MSVSVVSCLYGSSHQRYVSEWAAAIAELTTRPYEVIVCTDRETHIPSAHVFVTTCHWRNPQAWYLQNAVELAMGDWTVIADIDDLLLPDALDGLADTDADVCLLGFDRGDETYIPVPLANAAYLASTSNPYPGSSAFRTEAFHQAGGFPDVAFQDWALWRRLAASGASFTATGRTHFRYRRHDHTRTNVELLPSVRAWHLAELLQSESLVA